MKSILGRSIVLIVLLLFVPLSATAQQDKIDKPIFGFYLGESKQSLLQRAKQEGIAYRNEKSKFLCYADDGYVFDFSLNKSKLCKNALIGIVNGYVAQVVIQLVECPYSQRAQIAQAISESWQTTPEISEFAPNGISFTFTCKEAIISMSTSKDLYSPVIIMYNHLKLCTAVTERTNKTVSAEQF